MLSDSARRSRSVWYDGVTSAVAVEPRQGVQGGDQVVTAEHHVSVAGATLLVTSSRGRTARSNSSRLGQASSGGRPPIIGWNMRAPCEPQRSASVTLVVQ